MIWLDIGGNRELRNVLRAISKLVAELDCRLIVVKSIELTRVMRGESEGTVLKRTQRRMLNNIVLCRICQVLDSAQCVVNGDPEPAVAQCASKRKQKMSLWAGSRIVAGYAVSQYQLHPAAVDAVLALSQQTLQLEGVLQAADSDVWQLRRSSDCSNKIDVCFEGADLCAYLDCLCVSK